MNIGSLVVLLKVLQEAGYIDGVAPTTKQREYTQITSYEVYDPEADYEIQTPSGNFPDKAACRVWYHDRGIAVPKICK
jgi:hypothetical protein